MKDKAVKIQITEEEWTAFPEDKKQLIKQMIKEQYGWDISSLILFDEGDKMVCPYCDDEGCDVCQDFEGKDV
jgi:hypothetical protein